MRHQLQLFLVALTFYTRTPCPKWVDHSVQNQTDSTRYLVCMGWLIGTLTAAVLLASLALFPDFSPWIAVIFSTLSGVLLTGALHEDGFADVCDGFGGGFSKEKVLQIMKDSSLGTYGTLGLLFILLLKMNALVNLVKLTQPAGFTEQSYKLILILITGHSASRFMAYAAMVGKTYVRTNTTGKSANVATQMQSWWSTKSAVLFLTLSVPLCFFASPWILIPLALMWLTCLCMSHYFMRKIGGYTGDCLGAVQQVTEVIFYLTLLVIWKFI